MKQLLKNKKAVLPLLALILFIILIIFLIFKYLPTGSIIPYGLPYHKSFIWRGIDMDVYSSHKLGEFTTDPTDYGKGFAGTWKNKLTEEPLGLYLNINGKSEDWIHLGNEIHTDYFLDFKGKNVIKIQGNFKTFISDTAGYDNSAAAIITYQGQSWDDIQDIMSVGVDSGGNAKNDDLDTILFIKNNGIWTVNYKGGSKVLKINEDKKYKILFVISMNGNGQFSRTASMRIDDITADGKSIFEEQEVQATTDKSEEPADQEEEIPETVQKIDEIIQSTKKTTRNIWERIYDFINNIWKKIFRI